MIRLDLKNLPIGFAYFFVLISLFFVCFVFLIMFGFFSGSNLRVKTMSY